MSCRLAFGVIGEQQLAETSSSSNQPGFDRAQVGAEHLGHFLIDEALNVTKNQRHSEWLWYFPQRCLNPLTSLGMGCHLVRRFAGIDEEFFEAGGLAVLAIHRFCFDGDFLLLMPAPPATLVQTLVESYAINPGAERGLTVERLNSAKDLDKDVLRKISGVGGVADGARQQAVDRLVVAVDEP